MSTNMENAPPDTDSSAWRTIIVDYYKQNAPSKVRSVEQTKEQNQKGSGRGEGWGGGFVEGGRSEGGVVAGRVASTFQPSGSSPPPCLPPTSIKLQQDVHYGTHPFHLFPQDPATSLSLIVLSFPSPSPLVVCSILSLPSQSPTFSFKFADV